MPTTVTNDSLKRAVPCGNLDWHFQRSAAEADVRGLRGVVGVTDHVVTRPSIPASDVRDRIKAAPHRNVAIEADHIPVTTDGGKVTLDGEVGTGAEDRLAVNIPWSAASVTLAIDHLDVGESAMSPSGIGASALEALTH